jgi:hypothetical protein
MTTRIRGIVVAVACSASGTAEVTTNLKPFDPVAFQGAVEAGGGISMGSLLAAQESSLASPCPAKRVRYP